MFKLLILVCSLSTPQADCDRDTAREVMKGPDTMVSQMCGLFGQSQVANTDVKPQDDEYLKLVCTR